MTTLRLLVVAANSAALIGLLWNGVARHRHYRSVTRYHEEQARRHEEQARHVAELAQLVDEQGRLMCQHLLQHLDEERHR